MALMTKVTAGLLTFATLTSGVLPATALPATMTTRSNLRTGASLTAQVEEILPSGSTVEVLNITVGDDGKYWYYVQPNLEGTLSGWVRNDLVSMKLGNKRYGTITGKRGYKVNVRSSPNLTGKVVRNAASGDLVTIEDSYQEVGQYRWYRIRFPGNVTGWVREDLLSIWPKGCIITCPQY
jgi:uncharacterized protein YgiM (DUF1202 family)